MTGLVNNTDIPAWCNKIHGTKGIIRGTPFELCYTLQDRSGTLYSIGDVFSCKDGILCMKPPWSKVVAVDLRTGNILWERVHGLPSGIKGADDSLGAMYVSYSRPEELYMY